MGKGGCTRHGAPPSDPPIAPTAPKASTRRSTRSAVAQALAALALILTLGTWLSARDEGPAPAAAPEAPVSGASPTRAASAPPTPQRSALDEGILSPGRHSLIAEGVTFSFRVPRWGWENHGDTYLSSSTPGGGVQDAEAIIYWTQISGGDHAHPCGQCGARPWGAWPTGQPTQQARPGPSTCRDQRTSPSAGAPPNAWCSGFVETSRANPDSSTPGRGQTLVVPS